MKNVFRIMLVAAVVVAALAVSGSALAAYTTPKITVTADAARLGVNTPLRIRVEQSKDDDATFRVAIYVPQGYSAQLTAADGTQIGTVNARVQANAISPDAIVDLPGVIKVDSYTAAKYPTALACLGTSLAGATIAAVHRLELSSPAGPLVVPLYAVPITAGPLAAGYQAVLVACLPSPYIPPPAGAALGAKLIIADILYNQSVFQNPGSQGLYRWTTTWTPWTVGPPPGPPNATGTVEAQSLVRLPSLLTLNTATTRRKVSLRGRLTAGGQGVASAPVQLQLGRTRGSVARFSTANTNAAGNYVGARQGLARGFWFARTRTIVPTKATACTALFAPVPCVSATAPGFTAISRIVRFRIR